jgi:glycosyltransferase involved in cell wall biosynthesis
MPAPRRIAFVITDLDPGGAERALVEVVTRLDRARWEPHVFNLSCEGELSGRLRAAGIPCDDLGRGRRPELRVIWRLYRALAKFDPALVQSFLFHANMASRLAALLAGIPVVVAGVRVAEHRSNGHLGWDRRTQPLVTHNVCVSEAVARFSSLTGGLSSAKVSVIPNGVDFARFQQAVPLKRTDLGIPDAAPLLVGVGRLDPQKGWETLIDALPAVWSEVPETRLLIAGDGPERSALQSRIETVDPRARIRLLGYRDDVPRLLKTANLLVAPSRWEGLPNAVLEAMAAGCPIVASSAEGVTELLTHDRHGLVVPIGDTRALAEAILRLVTKPDEAKRLGAAAAERARLEFTWDRVASAYEDLYRRLLAARSTASPS